MHDNRRMSQMTVPEMPAVSLADRGLDQPDRAWVMLSVVASAVVVGWVSAGVLRARPIRIALVSPMCGRSDLSVRA